MDHFQNKDNASSNYSLHLNYEKDIFYNYFTKS